MPSTTHYGRRAAGYGYANQPQTGNNGFEFRREGASSSHRKVVSIGDVLDDRYRVLYKIKQNSNSISYLCRDLEEEKWRRVTVAKSHQFRTAMNEYEQGAEARRRLGEKEAERQGFCLRVFSIAGPRGVYMSVVYPLASHEVTLSFRAPYDEAYYLNMLRQWEELDQ